MAVFKNISHIRPNHLSGYVLVPMWPDNRGRTVIASVIVIIFGTIGRTYPHAHLEGDGALWAGVPELEGSLNHHLRLGEEQLLQGDADAAQLVASLAVGHLWQSNTFTKEFKP